jgi:hypothetical protein
MKKDPLPLPEIFREDGLILYVPDSNVGTWWWCTHRAKKALAYKLARFCGLPGLVGLGNLGYIQLYSGQGGGLPLSVFSQLAISVLSSDEKYEKYASNFKWQAKSSRTLISRILLFIVIGLFSSRIFLATTS